MIDDLREKVRSIRQSHTDDLSQLMDNLKDGKITGEQYREQAAICRAKFFEDDKLAHAEMSERVKCKAPKEVPKWLSDPPKE